MWMNSVIDTSDAAPPPTPLKMATSWGIAVIFTKRAVGTAMMTPMNMASRMSHTWCSEWPSTYLKNVATTATSMPKAATMLPRRACLGLPRPFRATMNVVAENRYSRSISVSRLTESPRREASL